MVRCATTGSGSELAPDSRHVAVVKANAYGHGLVEIARELNEADAFAVARLSEAHALRAGGIVKPIILLEGFFDAADLPVIVASRLEVAVHFEEQLVALEQAQLSDPVKVWMKIDTGMHRLGVRPEEAEAFYQRLCKCKNVQQPVNIISHFSRADEDDAQPTEAQITRFMAFAADKPGKIDFRVRWYSLLAAGAPRLGSSGSFCTACHRKAVPKPVITASNR